MASTRIRLALLGGVMTLGVILVLLASRPRSAPGKPLAHPLPVRPSAPAVAVQVGVRVPSGEPVSAPSVLAVDLNSRKGDVRADLRLINRIFNAYRGAVRADNPIGENSEITAALTGRNRLGFAFIPADNPAINAKGELCDRWGTPYFFHQISGEKMEIRSAGPDRKLWTAEDEVLTP